MHFLLPPSLISIRVFDAVARHLSCSRAANELFLTQSAVSKQLHGLEEYLGVPLFTRIHHGLAITNEGLVYWDAIRPALVILTDATAKVRMLQADNKIINLGVPPTLGQKWLIPRLQAFHEKHPGIVVQFAPRLPSETISHALSAEIRFGRGSWAGMHAQYLLGREMHPICSPELLKRSPINSSADLLKHNLMEHIEIPKVWEQWFSENKVSGYDPRRAQRFEQFTLMIPSLLAGLGVAIMPRFLVEEELRKRKLTLIFKNPIKSEYGYYFISPNNRALSAEVICFSKWILGEAGKAKT